MKRVEDPSLLAALEGQEAAPAPSSSPPAPTARKAVSDPDVLALLEGEVMQPPSSFIIPDPKATGAADYRRMIEEGTQAARPYENVFPPILAALTDDAAQADDVVARRREGERLAAESVARGEAGFRGVTADDMRSRSLLEQGEDTLAQLRSGAKRGLAVLPEMPVNLLNALMVASDAAFTMTPSDAPVVQQPDIVQALSGKIRGDADADMADTTMQASVLREEMAAAGADEGFWKGLADQLRYGATHPGAVTDALTNVVGQMAGGGVVPGSSVWVNLVAQGLQAGGMNASEVRQALQQQMPPPDPDDIERTVGAVFGGSAALNTVLPKLIPGGAGFERVLAGQLGRGTASQAARVATPLVGEPVTEGLAEGADKIMANLALGEEPLKGAGAATGQGMLVGTPLGAVAGVADAAAASEQGRIDTENAGGIVDILDALGMKTDPAAILRPEAAPTATDAPAPAAAAPTATTAPAPAPAPQVRTPAEVGTVIDTRLQALEEASAGVLAKEEVTGLVKEADELVSLLKAQRKLRETGALRSPDNSLTDAEMEQAEARLLDIRTKLEAHRTAQGAAQERTELQKKLDRIDNDNDLAALADKLSPPVTPAAGSAAVQQQEVVGEQAEAEEGSGQEGRQEGQGGGEGAGRVPGEAQAVEQGPVTDPLAPRVPSAPAIPQGATRESLVAAVNAARTPAEKSAAAAAVAAFDQANPDAPKLRRAATIKDRVQRSLGTAFRGVNVHSTVQEAPAHLRPALEQEENADVEGLYDPETGEVHIFESNLDTSRMSPEDRAVWVAAHERMGHAGIRGMAGSHGQVDAILRRAEQNPSVARVMKAMQGDRPETGPIVIEEALAELAAALHTNNFNEIKQRYGVTFSDADTNTLRRYIDNLVRAIRKALGLSESVRDEEIIQLLADANRYARDNDAAPTSRRGGVVASRSAPDFTEGRNHRFTHGDTTISYSVKDGEAKVTLVRTPPEARGKGSARRAMDAFLAKVDDAGLTSRLVVAEMDQRTDPAQLQDFYGSLGYQATGENVDGAAVMTRPKTEIVASRKAVGDKRFAGMSPEEVRATSQFLKNLTPAEQAKVSERTARSILAHLENIPDKKEMAASAIAGSVKRGWYRQSAQTISDVFGVDAPRFAALLAATSPQTSVQSNLTNALNIWKNWKDDGSAQEPSIATAVDTQGVPLALTGYKQTGGRKVRISDAEARAITSAAGMTSAGFDIAKAQIAMMGRSVEGSGSVDSVLDAWIGNSLRALNSDEPGAIMLSGPKVDSFMRNLLDDVIEVTNDAWMASWSMVEQTIFSGSKLKSGKDPGKGSGYLAMNARVRETAAYLTKLTGETWTPAEVQETVWSWAKAVYEAAGDKDEIRTAKELVEDQAVTDAMILEVPDFGTLFTVPKYAAILEEAGYEPQVQQLRAQLDPDRENARLQEPGARREGSPLGAEAQRKLEARSAARLDALRRRRLDAEREALNKQGISVDDEVPFSRRQFATDPYTGGKRGTDLAGLPSVVAVPGLGKVAFHGFKPAQDIAARYMAARGLGPAPADYVKVDPERAARIAAAYDRAKHDPQDPEVKAAYRAMIDETLAQYQEIMKTGLVVEFIDYDTTGDPYAASPRLAILDVVDNNHLWVFSTSDGYGTGEQDVSDNPMLEETAFEISGRKALANDIFRVVHDYFGHIKNGVGFRADGEENAWRSHSSMYSPLARRAMTSETRGQNSWVNYGPHGEHNRTASGGTFDAVDNPTGTYYSDQKVTLLPKWVSEEGAGIVASRRAPDTAAFRAWFDGSKVVNEDGSPRVVYHGTRFNFDTFAGDNAGAGWFGEGPSIAAMYADTENEIDMPGRAPNTVAAYLSIKNPLVLEFDMNAPAADVIDEMNPFGFEAEDYDYVWEMVNTDTFSDNVARMGYDGIKIREGGVWTWNAFRPNQIKSATGNSGAFDPANPSIVASRPWRAKKQQPDAVQVVGVHYSTKRGLKEIDPSYAGTGVAGRERRRFGMGRFGQQGGTAARVGFYVQEGQDLPPAEDVVFDGGGRYPYRVTLSNLYDLDADPRDLVTGNIDATEEAISDAGFDGFVTGGQSGIDGRVAVVYDIGKKKIPVDDASGIVASRGRQRPFDSKTLGKVIIPMMREAEASLSPEAKRAVDSFQMGVYSEARLNAIESDEVIRAEVEEAFDPVREILRQWFGDEVRLYRVQDKTPTGTRKVLSWSFSPEARGGAGEFKRPERPLVTEAGIEKIIGQLRDKGHVSHRGERYVRSKLAPEYPEYFMIYDRNGNVVTDLTSLDDLREHIRWDNSFEMEQRDESRKAMYAANVPVEQIKWIMANAISVEALVERDPAAMGDMVIASRRTPQQARQQRAAKLANFPQGSPTQQTPGGRFAPLKEAADGLRQKLQDKMLPVLRGQEATGAANAPGVTSLSLPDALNAYRMENLMYGRTRDRLEKADRDYILKMQTQMKRLGVSIEQLEDYLLARHAPERNARIAQINPAIPDGGSGITTADAQAILAGQLAGPYSGKPLDAGTRRDAATIAQTVDAMRDEALQNLVRSGQLTPALVAELRRRYKHYVPLRGLEGVEDSATGQGTGRGLSVVGKGIKRALGRKTGSYAQNILGEMVGDLQRSIVASEKSRVAEAFLRFALANPNKDLYEVEPVDLEWKWSESTGQAYLGVRNAQEDADTTMVVQHNGSPVRVRFNDPDLARAMVNLDAPELGVLLKTMGAINRWRSAVLTRFNPAFGPVNIARDAQFGIVAVSAEKGAAVAAKTAAGYPMAMRALWRDSRNPRGNANAATKTWDDWAREYGESGAKTGLTQTDSVVDLQRKLAQGSVTLMKLAADGKPFSLAREAVKRGGGPILKVIEDFNDATENALRLSVYVALRESGESVERAAEYAKNVTINFNRKGELGPILNAVYLFYNAAMQGAAATVRVLRNPKVAAFLGGMATLQYMMAAAMMGDDDDDGITSWDKVPDYVKRTSLVIPLGHITGNPDDYYALPMPYGFNVFPYAGGRVAQYAEHGRRTTDTSAVVDVLKSMTEAFSPVPLAEGGNALFGDQLGFMMGLYGNTDDFGNPIVNDRFAPEGTPKALLGRPDTPQAYHVAARAMAILGGGDLAKRIAPLGPLDVAPEQIEAVVNYLTGGIGSLGNKSVKLYEQLDAGNIESQMEGITRTPIAGRFVARADDGRAVMERYYGETGDFNRNMEVLQEALGSVDQSQYESTLAAAAADEPVLQGVTIDRYKRNANARDRREGRTYVAGDPKMNNDGTPKLKPGADSVFEEYRSTEKDVKAINVDIRSLRTGGMTNADVVAMIDIHYGPTSGTAKADYPDIGLPANYDAEAVAPTRIRNRAINLLQERRALLQKDFLRRLEEVRNGERE
jgi:GNAT superfamily N-acetyltransferase